MSSASATFKVGDEAEYDSYNFDYTGAILSIGPKSVTIKKESSTRSVRLDLHAFCWRNWNFDAAKTAAKNLEVMATI